MALSRKPLSAISGRITRKRAEYHPIVSFPNRFSLKDGKLGISSNRAERSMKPFVIDRKNFLFANTPKSATGSAVMFRLIQTAL